MARAMTPPITPPAIAPTFGPLEPELLGGDFIGAAMQTVFWQESQVGGTRLQTCPSGQLGQEGV